MSRKWENHKLFRMLMVFALLAGLLQSSHVTAGAASWQMEIQGPAGSQKFGTGVYTLPNGNFVVTDPQYNNERGAVYLYHGASGGMISMLTGSKYGDQVGSGGVAVLKNGNYVISSPNWSNPQVESGQQAGAATFGDQNRGVGGLITPGNSLVGGLYQDRVGLAIIPLSDGSYVVRSETWDNGRENYNVGAVTWGSGTTGVSGYISAANSLIGSHDSDQIGYDQSRLTDPENLKELAASGGKVQVTTRGEPPQEIDPGPAARADGAAVDPGLPNGAQKDQSNGVGWTNGVIPLNNGGYVVISPEWDNGEIMNAGAVTWVSGGAGLTGVVSEKNSLVGVSEEDRVGDFFCLPLKDGSFVVGTEKWDNGAVKDAGAVTWVDGARGIRGPVSAANSLVGSSEDDRVGTYAVELSTGLIVVSSPFWDNQGAKDAGAVTWKMGGPGFAGTVSPENSLVGKINDLVGWAGAREIANGSFVVSSPYWNHGNKLSVGALTYIQPGAGFETVTAENSLVGSHSDDRIGYFCDAFCYIFATPLENGNFVVASPYWDNGGLADAGAVTWVSGSQGLAGPITSANSLVGGTAGDRLGLRRVKTVGHGNYVALSPFWDNGAIVDAGAATWGDGNTGVRGAVSASNSLVGSSPGDQVGEQVAVLANRHYVVNSPYWDNAGIVDVGAVTWGDGDAGGVGPVSAAASLVGSTPGDQVGYWSSLPLSSQAYLVRSSFWDNGPAIEAGAVTWLDGSGPYSGVVSAANSLVGSSPGDRVGDGLVFELEDGSYVVGSTYWAATQEQDPDRGAATWGYRVMGAHGAISERNSVIGKSFTTGAYWKIGYDTANNQLVIGKENDNMVVLYKPKSSVGISPATKTMEGIPGEIVQYTMKVTNTGEAWDEFDLSAAGSWAVDLPETVGPLPPDGSTTVSVGVHVPAGIPEGSSDKTVLYAVSRQDDTRFATSELTTSVKKGYGVTLEPGTMTEAAAQGEMVTYSLVVTNIGNQADTFNIGKGGPAWTTTAPASVGPLAPGESQAVEVSVVVPETAPNYSADTATITFTSKGDSRRSAGVTLTTTANGIDADLETRVALLPPAVVSGGQTSIAITVSNLGPAKTGGVVVTAALPPGVTFLSGDPGCTAGSGAVTCALGEMLRGGSRTARVAVTVGQPGWYTSAIQASGAQPDPYPQNNQAEVQILSGACQLFFSLAIR